MMYFAAIIIAVLGFFIYKAFQKSETEKAYNEHLRKSMEDEFIIDPETGAKLTLEEAESGHWIQHDNEFRTKTEEELSRYFHEEEKETQRGLNFLRESSNYLITKLNENELDSLEKSKTLTKYADWSYSDSFRNDELKSVVFVTTVTASNNMGSPYHGSDTYSEPQLMTIIDLNYQAGHYYFVEKSLKGKLFEVFDDDNSIKLDGYQCHTFDASDNIFKNIAIIKTLQGIQNIEIEFLNNYLLLKTRRYIRTEDVKLFDKIISQLPK